MDEREKHAPKMSMTHPVPTGRVRPVYDRAAKLGYVGVCQHGRVKKARSPLRNRTEGGGSGDTMPFAVMWRFIPE